MCLVRELEQLCEQNGLPATTAERLMERVNDGVRSVRVEQEESARLAADRASYVRNSAGVLKSAREGDMRRRYEAVAANIDAWGITVKLDDYAPHMNVLSYGGKELGWHSISEKSVIRAVRALAANEWRRSKILERCLQQQWQFDFYLAGCDRQGRFSEAMDAACREAIGARRLQEILRRWTELRSLAVSSAVAEHLKKVMAGLKLLHEADRCSLERVVGAAAAEVWNEKTAQHVQDV